MVAVASDFHQMEKSVKTGLSLKPALRQRAITRSNEDHRGNFSAYVSGLIEADLDGAASPSTWDGQIIGTLAGIYAGYLAPTLRRQLRAELQSHRARTGAEIDEPQILHRLLQQLTEHFARGGNIAEIMGRESLYDETVRKEPVAADHQPQGKQSPSAQAHQESDAAGQIPRDNPRP
jgi:uncharacterized membrane-anchored protein YhcB (DUF1043 family)